MIDTKEIFNELRDRGFRVTKQRQQIVNVLVDSHLTLPDIHLSLKRRGYRNLATVYNNLQILMEENIVSEIYIDGVKYYELNDIGDNENSRQRNNHIHVTCTNNHHIFEIHDQFIIDYIKNSKNFDDFDIKNIKVHITGKCSHKDHMCTRKEKFCAACIKSEKR